MKWKNLNIPDLENYQISDTGLLKNSTTGKLMKTNYDIHGYERLTINKKGKRYNLKIHQLVAKMFLSPPKDPKYVINHKDGNKSNNCLTNLEWISQSENLSHAIKNGLKSISGTNNPACKTSESDIRKICEYLVKYPNMMHIDIIKNIYPGILEPELTRKKKLVSQIKTKSRWKIISDEYF